MFIIDTHIAWKIYLCAILAIWPSGQGVGFKQDTGTLLVTRQYCGDDIQGQ